MAFACISPSVLLWDTLLSLPESVTQIANSYNPRQALLIFLVDTIQVCVASVDTVYIQCNSLVLSGFLLLLHCFRYLFQFPSHDPGP